MAVSYVSYLGNNSKSIDLLDAILGSSSLYIYFIDKMLNNNNTLYEV